ncbi:NgrE [Xenorhabdus stockiae]|uniref:NgrE n=1 Tax=Xenorhabdus stockiae TaxID=351614 RepID=A0A2D0KAL0_9GAMM|nr:tail fiber protein [Xenorhabdus stockiae]PHM60488.1 NgrE [Xenorhabdus stockiae]
MIYTQGTLSTVSGSAIVRGTGTKFKDNLNGIAPGQVILIQSGSSNLLHLIQAVNSDTELVLADKAKTTLNNVTYQIQTTVPNSISDGVRHMCAINSSNIQFLQNMDKWMTQNGTVEVTLPNGQTVSLQSIKTLQEGIANAYPKTGGRVNGDIHAEKFWTKTALNLGEGDWGEQHGINITPVDGAGFEGNNVELRSWYGIGFKSSLDKKTHIYFDTREGHIAARGNINARQVFSESLMLGGGSVNYGRVDAASFEGNNIEIRSWYGIGFYSTFTEQTSIFFNARTGDISTRGTIRAGNGVVLSLGQNCHQDGSGYIRPSSPIIEIFPSGKFTTNDESEGATVSKLGLGHYQITGVLGYNADGAWGVHGGISSPKNNNGLELIYIDDKVNKDGSITIETFHRQHSHLPARFQNKRIKAIVNGEKVYYQDGEPCDIPEGCRLDVRVQMPENSVWNVKQKVAEVATDSEQAEQME